MGILVFLITGLGWLTSQGLLDLLEDDDSDLDATLGGGLEHVVETVLVVLGGRAAEVQLGRQPPVEDVDALLGLCIASRRVSYVTCNVGRLVCDLTFEGLGEGPEVGAAIDVPFGVARGLGGETLEAVLLVLGVEVVAGLAVVGVRVLVLLGAEEAREALLDLLEDIHGCCDCGAGELSEGVSRKGQRGERRVCWRGFGYIPSVQGGAVWLTGGEVRVRGKKKPHVHSYSAAWWDDLLSGREKTATSYDNVNLWLDSDKCHRV